MDYLNEISKYTGWEYEYVQGDVSELLNMLVAGELDIMGGMYYDEWMDDLYEFPDYNMGYNYGILFGRADDTSMNAYDIESIQGKTIGVFEKATAKIERLKKYTWIIILYPATLFTMEKRI